MTITATQRTELIKATVALFNAAPGSVYLSNFVPFAGNVKGLIEVLVQDPAFTSIYPAYQTSAEFAGKFIDTLVGTAAVDATKLALAKEWYAGRLEAGETRAAIAYEIYNDLNNTPTNDPVWGAVATQFQNKATVAEYYSVTKAGNATGVEALQSVVSSVTSTTDVSTPAALDAVLAGSGTGTNVGQTLTLTVAVDQGAAFAGTSANDTFVADYDVVNKAHTLGSLDVLGGAAGVDTLKISSENGTAHYEMAAATISGIEKIEIRGSDVVIANVSGSNITGLESISVLKGAAATVTAADTTDITISGVSGEGAAYGGKNVTVTNEAGGITVGKTDAYAVGAINVTATKQADAITIDGGSTVTVTATHGDDSGTIKIGAGKAATGAVSVTQNLNADGTETGGLTGGDVMVEGGSTVTVTSNLNVTAKDQTASNGGTFGDVTVIGDGKTTTVTVAQNYTETEFTKPAVAVVKELHTVTFKALAAGKATTVDGLTFTAGKALTAAEVAQAFSNLTAADTQTSGGKVANGVFSGKLSANFTSGAANGAVVVFTAIDEEEELTLASTADVAPTEVITAGTVKSDAITSANTAAYGAVVINDAATAAIKTITLNGYASATLGGSGSLDALTTLSLANSDGAAALTTAATALDLTVNNVTDAVSATSIKTLNVTATGKNSAFELSAATVEALTVAGDKSVDLTDSTLTALKTVTVSGSAGLTIDASTAAVTSVNTTATTGTVTAKIDASKATYTGGAGVDNVTLSGAVSKAVSTGAGNDSVTLAAGTTTLAATVSAGDGTDTLVMAAADAATASETVTFETKIDGFEKLSLKQVGVEDELSVNLANLDDISYVISAGAAELGTLTLTEMANNGTLELTGEATTTTVEMADATGDADSFNIVTKVDAADLDFGAVVVADVETINITATDISPVDAITGAATISEATLVLTADAAKTVKITGESDLALSLVGSAAVTLVDASTGFTGKLDFTAEQADLIVKGGSAADTLVAKANDVKLYGNGGGDTLVVEGGDRVNLYGGEGKDTFIIAGPTTTVSTYAVIRGVDSGDTIKLYDGEDPAASFKQAKVTLSEGATVTLQALADQAIKDLAAGEMGWFQTAENTYIVLDAGDNSTETFVNGTDVIVMLTGLVDLSTASFNVAGTLEIA